MASEQSGSLSAGGGTTLGIFHEAKLSNADRSLNGHSTASVFGNVKIDLTADDLPAGESHLHIYSIFGAVEVFALNEVGVRITGISLFSSVKVRGAEIGNGVFSGHE